MSGRRPRVEQAMRDVLSEMIARDIKDPRVRDAGLLTVQRVELNEDLSVARVYVSVFGDDAVGRKAVAGLVAAAGFLRGPLARRLHLQRPPELRFLHDVSPEMVLRIADVIRDDAARAAVAGRQPGQDAPATPGEVPAVESSSPPDDEVPSHDDLAAGQRPSGDRDDGAGGAGEGA